MNRKEEFDFARVPAVLYHGAGSDLRDSIEKNGLKGGHITIHPELAAEYAGPDLYEITKHPNIVSAQGDPYGDDWAPSRGVYWANGVPTTHVKRVGHVITHFDEYGDVDHDEIHWHKKEDCPLNYDMVGPVGSEEFWGKNNRPHPTNPNLMVCDY